MKIAALLSTALLIVGMTLHSVRICARGFFRA